MKQIEITDEIVNKVAEAEFQKYWNKKYFKIQPLQIKVNWRDKAREMLENYNRVIEIMSE